MRPLMVSMLATSVIAATACGIAGSGDGPSQGTGDRGQWSISAALSRPTLTVQHGNTDTTTLTITRSGGFTGDVTVGFNPPPGITLTASNQVTVGNVTTVQLSVTTGTTSDLVYSTVLRVQVDTKVSEVNSFAELNLNITRKNGFWTTAPAAMSVPRGTSSGPTRVTFTKTGFSDDATASIVLAAGVTGITAVFTPNPIVGDTVTNMVISVDPSVAEGVYNVGVRMNGGGYQGTAPLALTVTPAPGLVMSFTTNPLTITRGMQNATTINLARTNLTAGITPVVTSALPAGVTVGFGPPTAFGATVSMNVMTTGATPLGTFTIDVASGGAGVPVVSIPLTVTIMP